MIGIVKAIQIRQIPTILSAVILFSCFVLFIFYTFQLIVLFRFILLFSNSANRLPKETNHCYGQHIFYHPFFLKLFQSIVRSQKDSCALPSHPLFYLVRSVPSYFLYVSVDCFIQSFLCPPIPDTIPYRHLRCLTTFSKQVPYHYAIFNVFHCSMRSLCVEPVWILFSYVIH